MYARKVIHISAADSPNVKLALRQQALGRVPTGELLLPGVIDWPTYQHRLATWDAVRICQSVHGQFYEGAEVLLFPPEWLNLAEQFAATLEGKRRRGGAMGVDSAEGGDATSWAIVDDDGLYYLESRKTPNTAIIPNHTIFLLKEHNIKPENVMFDQGGGGYEHVCVLHERGYNCKMVSFGEAATTDPVQHKVAFDEKLEDRRERYSYTNRRAQIYWQLHLKLEPVEGVSRFAIPAKYQELRRQLAPMPRREDGEGRIYMMPKRRKAGAKTGECLEDLIGRSPDDADAVVLAVYGLDPGPKQLRSGVY